MLQVYSTLILPVILQAGASLFNRIINDYCEDITFHVRITRFRHQNSNWHKIVAEIFVNVAIITLFYIIKKTDMIDFGHILLSSGVIQGLLLLLPRELMPDENFEEWLNDDGFVYNPEKFGDKRFIYDELERVKTEFRDYITRKEPIVDDKGKNIPAVAIYNWIESKKVQINKLRLILNHEISYGTNLHKPTGVKYVVFRTYWIDNRGKKFRKFAKNIGAEEKVLVNGNVPIQKVKEVEKEIDRMMWDQYKQEYPK